jgi:hypothetical protein
MIFMEPKSGAKKKDSNRGTLNVGNPTQEHRRTQRVQRGVVNGGHTMKRMIIAAGLAIAFAGTGFAQTTTEWYVVQDTSTKKCTVVDKKPTTTTSVSVGNGVFKTRTEAESGMKTIKVCTN